MHENMATTENRRNIHEYTDRELVEIITGDPDLVLSDGELLTIPERGQHEQT